MAELWIEPSVPSVVATAIDFGGRDDRRRPAGGDLARQ